MGVETLDAVADRGYYASKEIRACEEAGITVTLPKPMTSNSKAAGRYPSCHPARGSQSSAGRAGSVRGRRDGVNQGLRRSTARPLTPGPRSPRVVPRNHPSALNAGCSQVSCFIPFSSVWGHTSVDGMVRPCSCPWPGAPKTRSTPCLKHSKPRLP
jgi:hypothetical protein